MSNVIDLGDFIPQTFTLKFTINGHAYAFEYAEATVDEVLRLLAERPEEEKPVEKVRQVVCSFLERLMPEGQRSQFREDLATVPYLNEPGRLSIKDMYAALQHRYTKKDLGDE